MLHRTATLKRVATHQKDGVHLQFVAEEETIQQALPKAEAEERRIEESMEGVETSGQTDGVPSIRNEETPRTWATTGNSQRI